MNDIILSSLLNLFALFSTRNKMDRDKTLSLLSKYMKRYLSVQSPRSYINLFSDLRSFYEDCPDIDIDGIIAGVCKQLKDKVSKSTQYQLLLRLMEFCMSDNDEFNPDDPIFVQVARNFGVSQDTYNEFCNFTLCRTSNSVLQFEAGECTLTTYFLKELNLLFFKNADRGTILLNDVPVFNNVFQEWQKSSVVKGRGFSPMYFSTVMARYSNWKPEKSVRLCGRNIEFRFDNNRDFGMHDFSFDLESGQLVAIMGGSGVGKSTLLSLLNGNLTPQSGSITINGHDIAEPQAKALIGYVPQDDLLIEELTVYQNLWYTAKFCFNDMGEEEIDAKVMSILGQLGLEAAKDLKVGSPINKYISGGQRKRLNIALELIREPAILYLDEPTSGLSSSDTEKVVNLLKEQTEKGKLVIANIHQPSSDVYKLFTRLWILDKGGYPIYDGNPIDAISYFKGKANFADADVSACPTCGNVNPEIILNIVDEKVSLSPEASDADRKVSPQMWHKLYLEERKDSGSPETTEVPSTDQKRPGILKQAAIFIHRNVNARVTNLQYLLVTLLEAPVLALVCAFLTRYTPTNGIYSIMENKNLPSFMFMAIIVAIFLGMSGSAEEIIKDRLLLKREKFLNLSYGSYIWSKIIYMAIVCFIQTFLFTLIGTAVMGIHGMFFVWWLILFLSALLSALIGLLLSQCLSSVVAIYITIPVLLIPQILLCGLVVDFDDLNPNSKTGNVPVIGNVIPSRWAYEALAVSSFSMNGYEKGIFELEREKFSGQYYGNVVMYELKSQLETLQDEINRGETPNPAHLAIIKDGLYKIGRQYLIDDYTGDWTYNSLEDYLLTLESSLNRQTNRATLEVDAVLSAYAREHGMEALVNLKRDNCNKQLENLVTNMVARKGFELIDNTIVPRCHYIFLTPSGKFGGAPFYSGVKTVGDYEVTTLWYNTFIMLLMCILFTLCLRFDLPGRYVRKERN